MRQELDKALESAEAVFEKSVDEDVLLQFQIAMHHKLAVKRGEGRCGWYKLSTDDLQEMLVDHVNKNDWVDIANIAMFLWALEEYDADL
jgi:hypothetical protein